MYRKQVSQEGVGDALVRGAAHVMDFIFNDEVKGKWSARAMLRELQTLAAHPNPPKPASIHNEEIFNAIRVDAGIPTHPVKVMQDLAAVLKAVLDPQMATSTIAYFNDMANVFTEAGKTSITTAAQLDQVFRKLTATYPGEHIPSQLWQFEMPGRVKRFFDTTPSRNYPKLTPTAAKIAALPRFATSASWNRREEGTGFPSFNTFTANELTEVLKEYITITQILSHNRKPYVRTNPQGADAHHKAWAAVKELKAALTADGQSRDYRVMDDSVDFMTEVIMFNEHYYERMDWALNSLGVFTFMHGMLKWCKLSMDHIRDNSPEVSVESIAVQVKPGSSRW